MAQTSSLTLTSPDLKIVQRFAEVRSLTEWLCEPLYVEDYGVQSMPDVSPPKWHLAHTTWFFERFVLAPYLPRFKPYHPLFDYLFNSYYKSVGTHVERSQRGSLSRPSVEEVYCYRQATDRLVLELLDQASESELEAILPLLELGLQHEQQHQELLLTDIKHILWSNPLKPVYRPQLSSATTARRPKIESAGILSFEARAWTLGVPLDSSEFCYDHEKPAHTVMTQAYGIHLRAVSCGEFAEFIEAGGYRRSEFWLSDGWDQVQSQGWQAPLYWETENGRRSVYTLSGYKYLDEQEPVCHVSYYEADAFARWRGLRLPTEAEWERAASVKIPARANLADTLRFNPVAPDAQSPAFYGNVWEWSTSAYAPYPGFKPLAGSLGEYNAKFMCNQFVLRGGSCATSASHLRPTYRNYFGPTARWQFSGLRLAL